MPAPRTPGPLFPRGRTLSGLGRAGCVTISTDSKPPWWGASRSRLRAAPGDACSRRCSHDTFSLTDGAGRGRRFLVFLSVSTLTSLLQIPYSRLCGPSS